MEGKKYVYAASLVKNVPPVYPSLYQGKTTRVRKIGRLRSFLVRRLNVHIGNQDYKRARDFLLAMLPFFKLFPQECFGATHELLSIYSMTSTQKIRAYRQAINSHKVYQEEFVLELVFYLATQHDELSYVNAYEELTKWMSHKPFKINPLYHAYAGVLGFYVASGHLKAHFKGIEHAKDQYISIRQKCVRHLLHALQLRSSLFTCVSYLFRCLVELYESSEITEEDYGFNNIWSEYFSEQYKAEKRKHDQVMSEMTGSEAGVDDAEVFALFKEEKSLRNVEVDKFRSVLHTFLEAFPTHSIALSIKLRFLHRFECSNTIERLKTIQTILSVDPTSPIACSSLFQQYDTPLDINFWDLFEACASYLDVKPDDNIMWNKLTCILDDNAPKRDELIQKAQLIQTRNMICRWDWWIISNHHFYNINGMNRHKEREECYKSYKGWLISIQ